MKKVQMMVTDYKKFEALENQFNNAGDKESAIYYMNKKEEVARVAEQYNLQAEFNALLNKEEVELDAQAVEMAKEFKKYVLLEDEKAKAGDIEAATYWMNKKWKTSRMADQLGIRKDFSQALKEIGVY